MDTSGLLGSFVIAYFLGSIPFGLILTRLCGMDIRKVGSGNIGATNVMRSGKKGLAIATLFLDLLKGLLAVKVSQYFFSENLAAFAGLITVLGHIFPIWLKFKGGKGVATTLGVLLGLSWMLALAVCAVWLIVFFISRISSLSAILSISSSPIIAYIWHGNSIALLCLSLAIIILFTHRQNIQRLLSGTEMAFKKNNA
jgi:glycerol-3-phosphate acyltransferase PlsY